MPPKLIVISGKLKGAIFPLIGEELSIGREISNQICLRDSSVSRKHCRLILDAKSGQFSIGDLDSFNGTFINGIPIHEYVLADGDHVKVGDIILLYVLDNKESVDALDSVLIYDDESVTRSAFSLRLDDAVHLYPQKFAGQLPTVRAIHDLNVLLEISSEINSIKAKDQLQKRLLELIGEALPAQRSAIILRDIALDEMIPTAAWSRAGQPDAPMRISRTITSQVAAKGAGILCNDIVADERLGEIESLAAASVFSLICVPLIAFDRTLGVIYADSCDPMALFDEPHLHLLTGIAAVAAVALEHANHIMWLESENRRLKATVELEHKMIGESDKINEVYDFITRVAPTDSTVLIYGESGTGKELVAHAIHMNSARSKKPFIAINCAALSDTLIESELFGHERGAFTGAVAQKQGKLEVANGGTLLLDEIGELAQPLQAKLLRVLQEREFERVGGTRPIKVNIRILAATNRDLQAAIGAGGFRQDLFFRLNVVSIKMPALRERRSDIPLLSNYFVVKHADRCNRKVKGFSAAARDCLRAYFWPGNVRELENAIEHAVVLGQTEFILLEDLPESVLETTLENIQVGEPVRTYYEGIREEKKRLILRAIEQAEGNYSEAARRLGIHPNNLHRLIRNLKLSPRTVRSDKPSDTDVAD